MLLTSGSPASASCLIASSNERLANFCLIERTKNSVIPLGLATLLDYRLKRSGRSTGIGFPVQVKQTDFQPFASPILYYSPDINGGNPNKQLVLGGVKFNSDPNLKRKKGMVIGVNFGLNGRSIYGDEKYIDINLNSSYAHSPKHNIGIKSLAGNFCSKNHIKEGWYFDICGGASRVSKKIQNEQIKYTKFLISKLLSSHPFKHHQNTWGLERVFADNYTQNQFLFSHQTLSKAGYLWNVTIKSGEPIRGKLVTRKDLNWSLTKEIKNKRFKISGGFRSASGGKVFGFDREEQTNYVQLSYQVFKHVNFRLGYTKTDSNIDYFSASEPTLSMQFGSLNF